MLIDDLSPSPSSRHDTRQTLRDCITSSLEPGDLVSIYETSAGLGMSSINGISVASLDFRPTELREMKAGAPVALPIEREGQLHFVTLDLV